MFHSASLVRFYFGLFWSLSYDRRLLGSPPLFSGMGALGSDGGSLGFVLVDLVLQIGSHLWCERCASLGVDVCSWRLTMLDSFRDPKLDRYASLRVEFPVSRSFMVLLEVPYSRKVGWVLASKSGSPLVPTNRPCPVSAREIFFASTPRWQQSNDEIQKGQIHS